MSRFAVFRSVYRVEYFASPEDREGWNPTREDFPDDFPAAEARAAELGKILDWVKLISVGMADTGTHLAAYGTNVIHEPKRQRHDRRGQWRCDCGAWLKDDAELARHQDLAGREPGPAKKD